jgi:lipopolysaccharide heptosyltransferase I
VSGSTRSDLAGRSFERILLVKPSSLGDVVHTLPVLHGLRSRHPKAKIGWLIAAPLAPLLESHRELDELVLFDRGRFGRLGRNLRVAWEFGTFLRGLRARRYDLVIDLQGLFRSGFLTWASGAGVRIGFEDAREGAAVFYTHRISAVEVDAHAVDRNYRVAQLLGFADVPIEFNLDLSESVCSQVRDMLGKASVTADDLLVVVVPGARWETKMWPAQRFAETIDRLHAVGGMRCVLLGGPGEVPLCERITTACRSSPINLAGRTNVPQLAAVIRLADLVLCQDSAAAHLAVAFDRPLVCLIGPTNPRRTGPYRRLDDVVAAGVPCAPCYLRRLDQCRHDQHCMEELSVSTVVAAAERSLAQTAAHGV